MILGQVEVLDWLRDQARIHPEKWFSCGEIIKCVDDNPNGVRRSLNKLAHWGLIDCETQGWLRMFRYKG